MLIFSTIAAIISPIIYLIPFLYSWKNKGHAYYKIPKTEKIIEDKYVFIAKILLITILSVLFVFTWPTKVMFYPVKVAIFILILVIIQLLTIPLFDTIEKSKTADKIFGITIICWFILVILTIAMGNVAGETKDANITEEPFESVETLQVEHISNGNVFIYDETEEYLEVISVSDESLQIILQENDLQQPYVKKITTCERYSKQWEKNKVLYDDMSTCSERYILYVSKADLYK